MGFYPLCPGKSEYIVGSPLFDRVTLNLPDGKKTVIEARGQSPSTVYVSKLLVDEVEHGLTAISHDTIVRGTRLTFMMQNAPAQKN
jgi:putative alpha-1,2-mannosidase